MLRLYIPESEYYDESTCEIIKRKGEFLELEHSLHSISKWESKWKKPFLVDTPKTEEELIDYIRCMTQNEVHPFIFRDIDGEKMKLIQDYMDDPMTATTIHDESDGSKKKGRTLTSELIYCWMASLQIPFTCEHWHINRLLTLIRVTNIENSPPKKMSKRDRMTKNRALNESRKQKFGTKG